eukprot:jgi/Bigna1/38230/e_gw1.24.48.1
MGVGDLADENCPLHPERLPLINISALLDGRHNESVFSSEAARLTVSAIGSACRSEGFFYITGTGVDKKLVARVETAARAFFALPISTKQKISMEHGGKAWRGYFPVGGELTSGKADAKEGLYIGEDLPPSDSRPLHGRNLLPSDTDGENLSTFREDINTYMGEMKKVAEILVKAIAITLGLRPDGLEHIFRPTATQLFRIFQYPPPPASSRLWGVGKHSDYGMLTILHQDHVGGLEVEGLGGDGMWIEAPPIAESFVVNLGDMLERITRGRLRATPHRVRSSETHTRISMPYFYDPGWDVIVEPLHLPNIDEEDEDRWDNRDMVSEASRPYGEVLVERVAKVFPNLFSDVMPT